MGEFLEGGQGALTLLADGSNHSFGLDAVRRLEVSRGQRSRRIAGLLTGFALGSGATYLVLYQGGSTGPCNQGENQDAMSVGACLGVSALGGVVIGALGAVVGGFIRSERWEDVALDRFGVLVMPGR